MTATDSVPDLGRTTTLDEFVDEARRWLEQHVERRDVPQDQTAPSIGGDFSVAVFHSLSFAEERDLLQRIKDWTMLKATRGYHAITAEPRFGGLGLGRDFARAYARLESEFRTPAGHETHSVTTRLIAPTIQIYGTPEQQQTLVPKFLAAEQLCCQLFSEPGAGSDLASLGMPCRTRRRRVDRQRAEGVELGRAVLASGAS